MGTASNSTLTESSRTTAAGPSMVGYLYEFNPSHAFVMDCDGMDCDGMEDCDKMEKTKNETKFEGLRLILKVPQDEYLTSTEMVGVKVAVSSQGKQVRPPSHSSLTGYE